jgi:hypothetical protein
MRRSNIVQGETIDDGVGIGRRLWTGESAGDNADKDNADCGNVGGDIVETNWDSVESGDRAWAPWCSSGHLAARARSHPAVSWPWSLHRICPSGCPATPDSS